MADEPSFRRVTPSGVDAALIQSFQFTEAVLRPEGDQGKNGVPGLAVEAVATAVRVSFAGGLAVEAAQAAAVEEMVHGDHVRPELGGLPASRRGQAFTQRLLEVEDAAFDRAVVLRVMHRAVEGDETKAFVADVVFDCVLNGELIEVKKTSGGKSGMVTGTVQQPAPPKP